jgi:NADP-dependent 3-hydroxy acid dehydrogenase YdfG
MEKPLLIIIGAGPGIGLATAKRFGRAGFAVGLVARREEWLKEACAMLGKAGIEANYGVADVLDTKALDAAIAQVCVASSGLVVLHYNTAHIVWKPLLDETALSLTEDFQVNVAGALTAVRAVLPGMRARQQGTILLTGSMFDLSPVPNFGSLSIGKAALRNLSLSLAKSLEDSGVQVAYVSVNGRVSADDPERSPDAIAELFWRIYESPSADVIVNI